MNEQPAIDFGSIMLPVAIQVLGSEPNKNFSTKDEARFGSRGAFSVNLKKGTWCDHSDGDLGGGVLDLLKLRKGLEKPAAMEWLRQNKHLPPDDRPKGSGFKIVAEYNYDDANGTLLFQVVRLDPKDFRQRRPDLDKAGAWLWKMGGMPLCIYRLPETVAAVAAGRTIFVVEGEKAVGALIKLGLSATCSPGGAGKWKPHYSAPLAGADVVILPDNDQPGRDHARQVEQALQRIARSVRVLALLGLPDKGDAADWIAAGGTAADLTALVEVDRAQIQVDIRIPEQTNVHRLWGDKESTPVKTKPEGSATTLSGFSLHEDGIALAFTAKHKHELRFDHHAAKWFRWTGQFWRQDETKLAFSWARATCRQLAKGAVKDNTIAQLAKASTAASVERFAQADEALAVTSEIWNMNPWLLGTPDGSVDLQTGEIIAPRATDHITKQTAVTPSATPDCPLWLQFLQDATANDPTLIRFLRQWCGYTLTGITREHALLFIYGPGGNGKSVFLNTVFWLLGGYAKMAAMEAFTAGAGDKHPTDLAMLAGARMVCSSETEEGRSWAETRIKQLTGGDPISARFMRQDFFTFAPVFKLAVIGNHLPLLRNVDEAARRRFNIVPFVHKPATPDRDLETKLRAEGPAILRWAIDGCLDWQENGLVRPRVVTEATGTYFSEQDCVRQWAEESCDTGGRNLCDTTEVLFKSWSAYALAAGEKPGTQKWFSQNLTRQGFDPVKDIPGHRNKRGFLRIAVKPVDTSGQWQRGHDA